MTVFLVWVAYLGKFHLLCLTRYTVLLYEFRRETALAFRGGRAVLFPKGESCMY